MNQLWRLLLPDGAFQLELTALGVPMDETWVQKEFDERRKEAEHRWVEDVDRIQRREMRHLEDRRDAFVQELNDLHYWRATWMERVLGKWEETDAG